MVSIAPNQFQIEGTVVSKQALAQPENFVSLVVQLEKVEHLLGPEEFLDPALKEIELSVQDSFATSIKKGTHISCKIRKAPGRFFIIPDSLETRSKK